MAGKNTKKKPTSKRKLTPQQIEEKAQAAERRARLEKEAAERKQRMKKAFTVIVCIILVLALGIPTVAISVLGMGA